MLKPNLTYTKLKTIELWNKNVQREAAEVIAKNNEKKNKTEAKLRKIFIS